MLREKTVAIVSQCQLRYENSTKKIVSSFPHAKAQGRMESLVAGMGDGGGMRLEEGEAGGHADVGGLLAVADERGDCPGRKPPF